MTSPRSPTNAALAPRPARERFFRAALRAMAPILVWALHFAVSYGLVAWGCVAWGAVAPLRGWLIAVGVAALAVVATLGVLAWRRAPGPLAVPAERWTALLALLGVAWTVVPAFVLPLCRFD